MRICLGVSGSVAAVKVGLLCAELVAAGHDVDVVVTHSAERLARATYRGTVPMEVVEALCAAHPQRVAVHRDADEWDGYAAVGVDPVMHIEVAKRCDLLLIAPLCANLLAQAVHGLCPNLLACVLRAWPYGLDSAAPMAAKPLLVAPAMNTVMWHQQQTADQLAVLKARGAKVIEPVAKLLACGDQGKGAMAEVGDIVAAVQAVADGTDVGKS